MRIWDTHTHMGESLHSRRLQPAQTLLRSMDDHGVERSLVIPFPVVADVPGSHNEIAAAVRTWPDRFTGCACIPPYDPRFHDELRRCVEEFGFRALKLQPQYHGLNPISARNQFFFEAAAHYKLPIVVHTGAGVPFALPSLYIAVARRFPELQLILGHAGGTIYWQECIVAADVCPNISVELSSVQPHQAGEIVKHIASNRLMIGSDLLENTSSEISKVRELDADDGVKQDILWNTAERLFGGTK